MTSSLPSRFTAADVTLSTFAQLSTVELYGMLQVRSEVFVVEQNCVFLDQDGIDLHPQTVHAVVPSDCGERPVAARDSHGHQTGLRVTPAGCARLLPTGLIDGPAGHPEGRSIGRVVTSPEYRSRGVASALLQALIDHAGHDALLTLNGQAHLRRFYEGFGFAVSGPEFIEDGIPHLPMRRNDR